MAINRPDTEDRDIIHVSVIASARSVFFFASHTFIPIVYHIYYYPFFEQTPHLNGHIVTVIFCNSAGWLQASETNITGMSTLRAVRDHKVVPWSPGVT